MCVYPFLQLVYLIVCLFIMFRTDIPEKELCAIMQSLQLQNPLLSIASDVSCTNSKNADNDFKSEPEKRLRNLQKRLKQITELKTKLKNGEKLEMNQVKVAALNDCKCKMISTFHVIFMKNYFIAQKLLQSKLLYSYTLLLLNLQPSSVLRSLFVKIVSLFPVNF